MSRNATHAPAQTGIALDHWQELHLDLKTYGLGTMRAEGTLEMLADIAPIPNELKIKGRNATGHWEANGLTYEIKPCAPVWFRGSHYDFVKAGGAHWFRLQIRLERRKDADWKERERIASFYRRSEKLSVSRVEREARRLRAEAAAADERFAKFMEKVQLPPRRKTGQLIWDQVPAVSGARATGKHSA